MTSLGFGEKGGNKMMMCVTTVSSHDTKRCRRLILLLLRGDIRYILCSAYCSNPVLGHALSTLAMQLLFSKPFV